MSKIEKKYMTNKEMIDTINWFQGMIGNVETHDKFNCLPFKIQLDLKRNIDELIAKIKPYEEFVQDKLKQIQKDFFTDEKSDDVEQEQINERGEKVIVKAKKIKDKYLDEYVKAINPIDIELKKLEQEKEEVQIRVHNMDELLENVPDDTKLKMSDILMLGFMNESE